MLNTYYMMKIRPSSQSCATVRDMSQGVWDETEDHLECKAVLVTKQTLRITS